MSTSAESATPGPILQISNYDCIAEKDDGARNWRQAISLFSSRADAISPQQLKSALLRSLDVKPPLVESDVDCGAVSARDFEHVAHITGERMRIPTLSFAKTRDYVRFMQRVGVAQIP